MLCSVPSPSGCLRATSEFLFLGTRGAAAVESGGSSAVRGNPVITIEQAVRTGVRNLRACTRVSLRPIPQWAALEGCTAVDGRACSDAGQASGQCARAGGALTRVHRACLWRAQRAGATRSVAPARPLPEGGAKARSSARGQRDVALWLTGSAASAFVDADQVRSSPLAAHCHRCRTLEAPLTIFRRNPVAPPPRFQMTDAIII